MGTPSEEKLRYKEESTYTEYRFPSVLGGHYMLLNFKQYEPTVTGKIDVSKEATSIALPLPNNLVDNYNINVSPYEMGSIGNITRNIVSEVAKSESYSLNELSSRIGDAFIKSESEDTAAILARKLREGVLKTVSALGDNAIEKGVELGLGKIFNPHIALTFGGVTLKTHSFSWQLAPESEDDSNRLNQIINKMKYEILPGYSGGKSFLDYPSIVDLYLIGSEDGFMYDFKRCMINSFNINYAGSGQPSFLPNGRPAVVNLDMSMSEMEIWTKNDFTTGTLNVKFGGGS